MSCFPSDRGARRAVAAAALLFLTGLTTPLAAQDEPAPPPATPTTPDQPAVGSAIVSSEYSMSGREALLRLELAGGRRLEVSTRDGGAYVDGDRIGDAPRGETVDRTWRELLTRAMDAQPAELPRLLHEWSPENAVGEQMKAALVNALAQAQGSAVLLPGVPTPISDSVNRLNSRIIELEERLERERDRDRHEYYRSRDSLWDNIGEGFARIFATLMTWLVIFGIGFLAVFFGGRKYVQGVSDTVRNATGRSFLVGLAAAFLFFPVYVIGALLLVISIVGIPGIIVWAPGLPAVMALSLLLGFLAVANAAGESFAERRLYVASWFRRGNMLYNLVAGIGLLLALFMASHFVHMAGNWTEPLEILFIVLGMVVTIIAFSTGLGAVLLSRAGTRPIAPATSESEPDLFSAPAAGATEGENANV